MKKELVYNFHDTMDFMQAAAYNCRKMGKRFFVFNGKVYLTTVKVAYADDFNDDGSLKVTDDVPVIVGTGLTLEDLL